jgi:hypothetical protein
VIKCRRRGWVEIVGRMVGKRNAWRIVSGGSEGTQPPGINEEGLIWLKAEKRRGRQYMSTIADKR